MNTGEPKRDPEVGTAEPGAYDTTALLTVPNVLTVLRLIGSAVLLLIAKAVTPTVLVVLLAALFLTDWLDGKLAVLLRQRSLFGARLDSVADAIFYACILVCIAWRVPEFFRSEAILIVAMLGTYALSVIVSLARFRRLPAYHTRAAKTCWFLAAVGAITLLGGWSWWPARIVLIAAIVTNVEAIAMSFVFRKWHADVPSILHAVRLARKE